MSQQAIGATSRVSAVRVPSLYDIFRGKLADGYRRIAQWRREGLLNKDKLKQTQRRRAARLEALEPRLLLSADLTYLTPDDVALDARLSVTELDGISTLQLLDNDTDGVLAEAVLDQEVNITIVGGDGDDSLAIDLDPTALPNPVSIAFDGGAGSDTLSAANQANTWQLTASGAGRLNDVVFTGVEQLAGGADVDTLHGPAESGTWTVGGTDSGSASGI
jgi:hypothetical protein